MPGMSERWAGITGIIVLGAYILATVIALVGIWLVYLGSSGSTEFVLFGQTFKSSSVGVAAIFIGVVAAVLLIRRSLQTIDRALQLETSSPPADLRCWPGSDTREALRAHIGSLSDTQWLIFETIARRPGKPDHHVLGDVTSAGAQIGMSELYHRISTLMSENLVENRQGRLFVSDQVARALGTNSVSDLRAEAHSALPPNVHVDTGVNRVIRDGATLRVPWQCVRKDMEGDRYIIPGWGVAALDESSFLEAKKRNWGWVMEDITPMDSTETNWVPTETFPI